MFEIDKKAAEPPYVQLSQILKQQIKDGTYPPGSQLPSEANLCALYKISPMTVRRAIQSLLDQSVVHTIKGRGTYVKSPRISGGVFSLEDFFSIFNDIKQTKVKVLDAQIEPATPLTAEKLVTEEDDPTILIKRLIIYDGEPLIYHVENLIYDPKLKIVETELEVTSLYGLFEGKSDSGFKWGKLSMSASLLSEEEAKLLDCNPDQPGIRLEHLFYDFSEKPVSWGRFICRGDRLQFTTTVGHMF